MSEAVRIGQIGCGRHGRLKLARALASVGDADLVSCADLDEGATLRTAREFGFARRYQDYGEMLATEELNGVVVALPHHRLAEAAVAAANAGYNIFVEKPVGVNKAQAVGRAFPLSRKPHTVIPAQAGIQVGGGVCTSLVSQLWKDPGRWDSGRPPTGPALR